MPKGQAKPHPSFSVKKTTELAQAIRDNNAGKPYNRMLLADAMGRKPNGPEFRELITASGRYGFTEGSYKADTISLTDRGLRLTKPMSEDERLTAMREAVRSIPILEQLLQHFNGNRLPEIKFLVNTLERPPYSLDPDDAQQCAEVFVLSGKDVGFIRDISGAPRVLLDAGPPIAEPEAAETATEAEPSNGATASKADASNTELVKPILAPERPGKAVTPAIKEIPLQLFVGHGREKGPLDEVANILTAFGITFVVAESEPHAGRPISQKVKELMDSCTAGVFIFTADEKFTDTDGNDIWRPRENVVFELGAGSYKFGTKIVVFKEKPVRFPSDFENLGYIEFEEGKLQAKTLELIRELVALKALKWTPGT